MCRSASAGGADGGERLGQTAFSGLVFKPAGPITCAGQVAVDRTETPAALLTDVAAGLALGDALEAVYYLLRDGECRRLTNHAAAA